MNINFKKQFFIYSSFSFLLLIIIQFSTVIVYANTYQIKNIEIQEPYDINFDKFKVIERGFSKAFEELILRITPSEKSIIIKKTRPNQIKELIDSFEIIDEKFIDNNYSAKVNVNFNKKSVLKFLEKKNIFSSIPINTEVFFIPVLIKSDKNEIIMFNEYNIWAKL